MPLDPSIILKVNTPAETQQASNQAALGVEQVKQAQNTTQQIPVANAQQQQNLQLSQIKAQTDQLDQQQTKLGLVSQLVGTATDQPSYDAAKQKALAMGLDVSNAPVNFDPNYVKNLQNQALTASQRIQLQTLQNEQTYRNAMVNISAGRLHEKTDNDSGALAMGAINGQPTPTYAGGIGAAPNPAAPASATNLPSGTLTPPTVAPNPTTGASTATLSAPQFSANGAVVPNAQNATASAPNPAATQQDLSKLTGTAYLDALKQQNPAMASMVEEIGQYKRKPPPATSGTKGLPNPLSIAVARAYPPDADGQGGYDATQFEPRQKTANDFSTAGKSGQNMIALNQLGAHLQTLDSLSQQLDTGSITPVNAMINYAQRITGNPNITNQAIAAQAVATEFGKIMRGVGMSEGDATKFEDSVKGDNSIQQIQGAANTMATLVGGRMHELNYAYDQNMGTKNGAAKFVNPMVQQILIKHDPKLAAEFGVAAPSSTGNNAQPIHPALATPQAAAIKAQLAAGKITQDQAIQQLQQATGAK